MCVCVCVGGGGGSGFVFLHPILNSRNDQQTSLETEHLKTCDQSKLTWKVIQPITATDRLARLLALSVSPELGTGHADYGHLVFPQQTIACKDAGAKNDD